VKTELTIKKKEANVRKNRHRPLSCTHVNFPFFIRWCASVFVLLVGFAAKAGKRDTQIHKKRCAVNPQKRGRIKNSVECGDKQISR
jgi:hypothetical protein